MLLNSITNALKRRTNNMRLLLVIFEKSCALESRNLAKHTPSALCIAGGCALMLAWQFS